MSNEWDKDHRDRMCDFWEKEDEFEEDEAFGMPDDYVEET